MPKEMLTNLRVSNKNTWFLNLIFNATTDSGPECRECVRRGFRALIFLSF